MPIPKRKAIEKAIEEAGEYNMELTSVNTLKSLAQAYLSGKLVKPMSEAEIRDSIWKSYKVDLMFLSREGVNKIAHAIAQAQKGGEVE